jgi:hypothetical protein
MADKTVGKTEVYYCTDGAIMFPTLGYGDIIVEKDGSVTLQMERREKNYNDAGCAAKDWVDAITGDSGIWAQRPKDIIERDVDGHDVVDVDTMHLDGNMQWDQARNFFRLILARQYATVTDIADIREKRRIRELRATL